MINDHDGTNHQKQSSSSSVSSPTVQPTIVPTTMNDDDTTAKQQQHQPQVQRLQESQHSYHAQQQREIPIIELSMEHISYHVPTKVSSSWSNNGRTMIHRKNKPTNTNTTTATNSSPMEMTNHIAATATTTVANKTILHDVSTTISPYQLTGWMGPSGSGKTTLMSIAANLIPLVYSSQTVVESESHLKKSSSDGTDQNHSAMMMMKVNGEMGTIPNNLIGVVYQDDLLLCNLTVEENLCYATRFKTSEHIANHEQVQQIVYETMKELHLLHVRSTKVQHISGGERKRVAVGMELVVRPSVLLLDEITSGLDSTTAYNIMMTLQELTQYGHSIVVIIHQPRTTIFNLFDHLLLLSKGHVIYDGHPSNVRNYFEMFHTSLPPETGIADWIMDIIIEQEQLNHGQLFIQQWIETRQNNDTTMKLLHPSSSSCNQNETISSGPNMSNSTLDRRYSSLQELRVLPKYNTKFYTQFKYLTYRISKQQRGERLTMVAMLLQLLYLFFTSLFWWNIPNTTSRIFERNSLLFFILIAQANGIVITAVTVFHRERLLLHRERAKKMYSVSSYFLAKTISDITNNVVLPLLYSMIVYWTANFRPTGIAYMKYIFVFYWIYSTAQSMGLFLSIFIPNPNLAIVLAPPITLFFVILGGFYIPFDSMHPGIKWATYLSFARYGYSALIINEYEGRLIPCSDDDSISIGVGGTDSDACPLPGLVVLESLGIYGISQNFWFNVAMVIVLQIIFRVGAYILLRRSK